MEYKKINTLSKTRLKLLKIIIFVTYLKLIFCCNMKNIQNFLRLLFFAGLSTVFFENCSSTKNLLSEQDKKTYEVKAQEQFAEINKLDTEVDQFKQEVKTKLKDDPNNPLVLGSDSLIREVEKSNAQNLKEIKTYQPAEKTEAERFIKQKALATKRNLSMLMVLRSMISVDSKIVQAEKSFASGSYELTQEGRDSIDITIKKVEKIAQDYLQIQSENRKLSAMILSEDTSKIGLEIRLLKNEIGILKKENSEKKQKELAGKERELRQREFLWKEKNNEMNKKPDIKFRVSAVGYTDNQDFSKKTLEEILKATNTQLPFPNAGKESEKIANRKYVNQLLSQKRAEAVFYYIKSRLLYSVIEESTRDIKGKGEDEMGKRVCKFSIIPVSIQ